jgi:hypothetical protein
MVDQDDFDRLQKKVLNLEKDLKEAKRLHGILDEYCTSTFKIVSEQIGKLREDLTKVASALAGAASAPKKKK